MESVTVSASIFGMSGKKYLFQDEKLPKECISEDWWIPMCFELVNTCDTTAYLKFECNGRIIEKKSYLDVLKYMRGDNKPDVDPNVVKYIYPLIHMN
jgi:hypothetical protein